LKLGGSLINRPLLCKALLPSSSLEESKRQEEACALRALLQGCENWIMAKVGRSVLAVRRLAAERPVAKIERKESSFKRSLCRTSLRLELKSPRI
jgi:hypothetical protein